MRRQRRGGARGAGARARAAPRRAQRRRPRGIGEESVFYERLRRLRRRHERPHGFDPVGARARRRGVGAESAGRRARPCGRARAAVHLLRLCRRYARSWELWDRPRARATRALLRALRLASRDPAAAEGLRRAGATPKLARCLQRGDAEARESAMRALRNVCLIGGDGGDVPGSNQAGTVGKNVSATALEHAAVAGATPHLVAVASGDDRAGSSPATRPPRRARGARRGRWRDRRGNRDRRERRRRALARGRRGRLELAARRRCRDAMRRGVQRVANVSRQTQRGWRAGSARVARVPPTASGRTKDARGPSSVSVSSLAATRALGAWLADEPWIVEARLMESDVVEAAVAAVAAVVAGAAGAASGRRRTAAAALGASTVAAAVDDATVDALAEAAARSPRWSGRARRERRRRRHARQSRETGRRRNDARKRRS